MKKVYKLYIIRIYNLIIQLDDRGSLLYIIGMYFFIPNKRDNSRYDSDGSLGRIVSNYMNMSDNVSSFYNQLDMDNFSSEQRMWLEENRAPDPDFKWNELEKYLNRLSETDKMLVYFYFKLGMPQKKIAKCINWNQSSVHFRLYRITNIIKLLMNDRLTYDDFNNTELTDREKRLLLVYDKFIGNESASSKYLNINQSSMHYYVKRAKDKIKDKKLSDRLDYSSDTTVSLFKRGTLFHSTITRY